MLDATTNTVRVQSHKLGYLTTLFTLRTPMRHNISLGCDLLTKLIQLWW